MRSSEGCKRVAEVKSALLAFKEFYESDRCGGGGTEGVGKHLYEVVHSFDAAYPASAGQKLRRW